MAGKRQRPIRRTVSASLMASGSNIFESFPLPNYLKEKQKAPLVVSSSSPRPMLAPNNLGITNPLKPPFAKADAISAPSSQASPLVHKFEKATCILTPPGWVDRGERNSVGLGVVAVLSEESCAGIHEAPPPVVLHNTVMPHFAQQSSFPNPSHLNIDIQNCSAIFATGTGAKYGIHEAPSPVVLHNTVMPHFAQQSSFPNPSHLNIDIQKCSAIFLHESPGSDDYDYLFSMALPAVNFLEACYLCKRRLSHSLDIYMYRGDQAFCSEECRHEQILLDERRKIIAY